MMNNGLVFNALDSSSRKIKSEVKEYLIRLSDTDFINRLNIALSYAIDYPIQKEEVALMFMRK
jgi:hypothetical protein